MLEYLYYRIKLSCIKKSIKKDDKLIAYIRDDNGDISKQRAVVESIFPGIFRTNVVVVEAEDREIYILSPRDIVHNYSAKRRYAKYLEDHDIDVRKIKSKHFVDEILTNLEMYSENTIACKQKIRRI